MKSKNLAVVFSVVMILSCFAGCIDTEEETTTETVILGNVMVSTYHVEQLVSAVAGDSLTVEIISPSNVPVHDYEPSVSDLSPSFHCPLPSTTVPETSLPPISPSHICSFTTD